MRHGPVLEIELVCRGLGVLGDLLKTYPGLKGSGFWLRLYARRRTFGLGV